MSDLVLSLGHNSSAILVENGKIVCGYEEERFTNAKSESRYPINAIQRIRQQFGEKFNSVSVGHWFTGGELEDSKYCNLNHLNSLSDTIHSVNTKFTHHDSHAESAIVFADHYNFPKDCTIVIADGFGTLGECISVYKRKSCGDYYPIRRIYGFWNSLGMFYQYATAYLEMKMHNHEYKILGYEAHIDEYISAHEISILDETIEYEAMIWLKKFHSDQLETDAIASPDALIRTRKNVSDLLDKIIGQISTDGSLISKRVIISYFVQNLVERVMLSFINAFGEKQNLLLSGGLFYNVKLNSKLADKHENICVMPLAGDQGAGLGVYQDIYKNLEWPGHLNWGLRSFAVDRLFEHAGIISMGYKFSPADVLANISNILHKDGMVNLVRGAMEFGPRSLCNTATLAKPTLDNVDIINNANGRTTIMPMAPVMTKDQANDRLIDLDKVWGSAEYMVVTRDVKSEYVQSMIGAVHSYSDKSTCRPQITYDPLMVLLLNEFGPLINTSFNVHGVPICFDTESVIHSHTIQNKYNTIKTVVLL